MPDAFKGGSMFTHTVAKITTTHTTALSSTIRLSYLIFIFIVIKIMIISTPFSQLYKYYFYASIGDCTSTVSGFCHRTRHRRLAGLSQNTGPAEIIADRQHIKGRTTYDKSPVFYLICSKTHPGRLAHFR